MTNSEKAPVSRKEELTSLAVDMMQTRGFSALGLRELAQAACMKAASLYSHFDSKDSLAQLAMALYSKRQREELALIDELPTANVRLGHYVQLFGRTLKDEHRLCLGLMLAVERNSIPEDVLQEIRVFSDQNISWLKKTWQLGHADKTICSKMSGSAAAPVIFGAAEGIMAFALLQPDPPIAYEERLTTLLQALGVQP